MESVVTREERRSKSGKASAPVEVASAEERALALAARLAEDLAAGWRRGERPRAEDFLAGAPDLAPPAAAALLIVAEEVRRRREFGPPPELDEFRRRFPQWEVELQPLFDSQYASAACDAVVFPVCGETVADCRLLAELGRGVQGRVFLAAQTSLANRLVVLKMGPRDCHEHLALARLLHTHIVPLHFVLDLPVHNLRVLGMPYLGGATLTHLRDELTLLPVGLRSGRDLLEALDRIQASRPAVAAQEGPTRSRLEGSSYVEALSWLGASLADALQYAHERNMLHLDLKPSNVLLAGDGQPLLLDFHLARPPLPAGSLPPGWFGGTPGYMSPEQRLALEAVHSRQTLPAALDGRSDVYSLGVVLFEMLSGRLPPEQGKAARRALLRANREVSHGLADVIVRCLNPDPLRRYQAAGALADDLRRHLAHQPLMGAPNRSLLESWRKWRRRRPYALTHAGMRLFLMVFFAAVCVLGWAYFERQHQDAEAALANGDDLLRRGLPAEAERSLARGRELAGSLPWSASLARALADKQRQAQRTLLARDLHRTADDLRYLCDPDTLSAAGVGELEAAGGRLWDARRDLVGESGRETEGKEEEQVQADLCDLAVLWVDLRARTPNGETEEGRRRNLEVLNEAEALFGPSAVLQYERAGLDGHAAKTEEPPPRTAWDHYALGRALLRDGKREAAAGELDRAVALRPQGFWPNFYQGVCAYRRRRFSEAEAAFRVCVALAPDAAPCHYNYGLAEAALGRPDRARADYDRALELDPGLGAAWLNRGVLDYQEKREDKALEDLGRALVNGADPVSVHFNLALTRRALGDNAGALDEVRAVFRVRPDHAGARELLTLLGAR